MRGLGPERVYFVLKGPRLTLPHMQYLVTAQAAASASAHRNFVLLTIAVLPKVNVSARSKMRFSEI